MTDIKQLRKLTMKDICDVPDGVEPKAYFLQAAKDDKELAAISGIVHGFGSKTTQFGESQFLTGMFMGMNRQTGEIKEAQKIYLPADITETIIAEFKQRQSQDEVVKFQLLVKVIEDKKSATGYAYLCTPIRDIQAVNRRAEMLASFSQVPALPAPAAKLAKK